MNSNDFLQIKYDAFPDDSGGLEDFRGIEEFKQEIEENYNCFIKGQGTGRGGSAYELIIHFISNLHWADLSTLIAIDFAKKVVTKAESSLLERLLFKPVQNAYHKLKDKNDILDCFSFQIELQDIKVFMYRTSENSLILNLEKILKAITTHQTQLIQTDSCKIDEIHIPVVLDILNGSKILRTPLGMTETKSIDKSDYFRYWGITYNHNQQRTIYDLKNRCFLSDMAFPQFYLEHEFIKEKFKNDPL